MVGRLEALKPATRFVGALALAWSAVGAHAAAPPTPQKMTWYQVCKEHGRHLRARTHDTERARVIAAWAKDYGFDRADIAVALNREPRLGMNPCAAMAAYGEPDSNNESIGAWGKHEQYVYRSRGLYLYFQNQVLTSFQR